MMETELGSAVVAYLEADGWTVYQEVRVGPGVADIIALREAGRLIPLIRHIECKTSLSVDLVRQAVDAARCGHAHFIEVAVPASTRTTRTQVFLRQLLREHGIGILEVYGEGSWDAGRVLEKASPRMRRIDRMPDPKRSRETWLDHLRRTRDWCERHQNLVPAGTNRGGFWTPYKGTMNEIRELLRRRGEATISEIMAGGSYHYSSQKSARASVYHALVTYESGWCEKFERDGEVYFRLRTQAAAC